MNTQGSTRLCKCQLNVDPCRLHINCHTKRSFRTEPLKTRSSSAMSPFISPLTLSTSTITLETFYLPSSGPCSAHHQVTSWSLFVSLILVFISLCQCETAPNINYSHNMRILKVPFGTPVGTLIYRLKGSDPDGDALTFGSVDPVGSSLLYFQPASITEADVYLKQPLTEDRYNLTVYVTDGKTRTQVDSSILVTKIPANVSSESSLITPFIQSNHLFTVFENATRNTTIGLITARERESSSLPVTFELRGSDKFTISYVFGPRGTSKAEIRLTGSLDFERQNLYSLTILAINAWTNELYDTRNVATIQILVAVRDVQDTPPKFISLPNVIRLTEDMKTSTLIATVTAEDGDFGLEQRNVTYSILESRFSSFVAIDSSTGDIFLRRPIQQLQPLIGPNNPFLVSIKASEEPIGPQDTPATMSTTIQMSFVLISSKNHPPNFATSQLTGTIAENSPNMTPVKWDPESLPLVTDGDAGANGTIYLSFERDAGIFTIVPNRGLNELTFSLLVRNNSILDYEKLDAKKSLQMTLVATDGSMDEPLSSRIPIVIHVTDVNDNAPQFTQSQYEGSIYEDSPIGTVITKVSAIDPDTGNYGKVKFTSLSGVLAKNLAIDENTGVVTLKNLDNLDREKIGSEQQVTVEVRDESGTGNRNRTKLLVKILDANDNAPQFIQARFDAVLSSDLQSFTQPLIVSAIDSDEPGTPNSNVTYEIIEGSIYDAFYINSTTGEIKIKSGAFRKEKPLVQSNSLSSVHPVRLTESEEETSTGTSYNPSDSVEPPSLITLKVRAHDQGIPMRSSTATVLIHRTDSFNRSLTFILPDSAAEVEKKRNHLIAVLTKLTGGFVEIREIHDTHKSSPGSIVHAWVTYPSKPVPVDLRKIGELFSNENTRQSKSKQQEKGPEYPDVTLNQINTASILRHEYQTLVYVLIFFIVLTLVFLSILLIIWWCCCCKSGSNATRAKWFHEMATGIKAVTDARHQMDSPDGVNNNNNNNNVPVQLVGGKKNRRELQQQDSTSTLSLTPPSPKLSKRSQKKQQQEMVIRSKHNNDVTFKPPGLKARYFHNSYPGYSMRTLKKKVKPDPGGYENDAFIDDAGKSKNSKHQQQTTTEIMYIRSPPIQMTDTEDQMPLDETDVDATTYHSSSTHPGNDTSRNALNEHARRRKVSFQMDPVYNASDTATTTTDAVNAEGVIAMTDSSSRANGPLANATPHPVTRDVDSAGGHVTSITLPGSVPEPESDRSDSDSGIGRRSRQEWNFKNADLMTKKSIFTLAYDGIKTERIRTGDSDPGIVM